MYVLWWRCRSQGNRRILSVFVQKLQAFFDGDVGGVEFLCTHICVHGIFELLIAALVERAEIEPDFGNVRVESDGAGIGVQCVFELIDLEVKDTDGDPERRVAAIAVYGLLISFIGFIVFLRCHVSATEEIPALGVGRI
jgi:hypothetical protein